MEIELVKSMNTLSYLRSKDFSNAEHNSSHVNLYQIKSLHNWVIYQHHFLIVLLLK